MALRDKYKELLDAAQASGATNLQEREQDNVLYVDADVPDGATKDKLWDIYNKLDPDFRAGDLVMNLTVTSMTPGSKAKVTTQKSNLNIRKGPGVDQPIVGKAAHHEVVSLVSQEGQWWLIRTDQGVEGYAAAQYLSPLA
ncbi:MAG: SH3 domain-containing protein [Candidatus Pseudobacter hemicellulosilyticus]|uniref:SH3 domain-containing protein n=1 Tax=Candidatus Pseudobacter hemicellulosilyticus TaxID=3121375 RepID=A0AAJ5WYR7_9BACT|nr:MAG: SH3 domain-containing protein [Pseudobacter sp.]